MVQIWAFPFFFIILKHCSILPLLCLLHHHIFLLFNSSIVMSFSLSPIPTVQLLHCYVFLTFTYSYCCIFCTITYSNCSSLPLLCLLHHHLFLLFNSSIVISLPSLIPIVQLFHCYVFFTITYSYCSTLPLCPLHYHLFPHFLPPSLVSCTRCDHKISKSHFFSKITTAFTCYFMLFPGSSSLVTWYSRLSVRAIVKNIFINPVFWFLQV